MEPDFLKSSHICNVCAKRYMITEVSLLLVTQEPQTCIICNKNLILGISVFVRSPMMVNAFGFCNVPPVGVSGISGMEWWNGLLEWTWTKSFHLHIILALCK